MCRVKKTAGAWKMLRAKRKRKKSKAWTFVVGLPKERVEQWGYLAQLLQWLQYRPALPAFAMSAPVWTSGRPTHPRLPLHSKRGIHRTTGHRAQHPKPKCPVVGHHSSPLEESPQQHTPTCRRMYQSVYAHCASGAPPIRNRSVEHARPTHRE